MSSCKSCDAPAPIVMCPSRMDDARAFTDYRPRCTVNAELYQMVGSAGLVKSSYESRMFLQHNAEKVMEEFRQNAVKNLTPCAPCTRPMSDPGTMLPSKYVVRCDGVTCSREEVDAFGIGDGRNYN